MFRGKGAHIRRFVAFAAALALAQPAAAFARAGVDRALEAKLMEHISVLASDAFEGREPGTEGEARTLKYLGREWFEIGLVSGTNDPGNPWFAPVNVVAREPAISKAQFTVRGGRYYVKPADVLVLTSGTRSFVRNAPVIFVGHGRRAAASRSEIAGRVALLLDGTAEHGERQNALLEAGAAAVLTVLDGDRSLDNVAARRQRSGYALADDNPGGDLEAFITREAADRLLKGAGFTLAAVERLADQPDFAHQMLPIAVTLEATTRETAIRTHNLIGKLPGKRPESGAVLFMAHWDHFGICAEAPAEDIICNGAIDNASGVASLTEIARRLARGPQNDRDIYFVATTAEELGLLGAHAFAEDPPLPISQIVAAFNIDSNAIAPAGSPLAMVGKGMTSLDRDIAILAKRERRKLLDSDAGNAYVRRQDGWALLQHDIPAVMVTSAYSDIRRMEAFFEGDYHRPSDQLPRKLELGGAVEDVLFHVALGRWFADPRRVPSTRK